MNRRVIVSAAASVALVLAPGVNAAPQASAGVCRSGDVTAIRLDKIKPGGSMAGFKRAFADQAKWYRSHGYDDRLVLAPVLRFDPATRAPIVSIDEVMTLHVHSRRNVPREAHDAAWNAYVSEYQANSEIETETTVCMPR